MLPGFSFRSGCLALAMLLAGPGAIAPTQAQPRGEESEPARRPRSERKAEPKAEAKPDEAGTRGERKGEVRAKAGKKSNDAAALPGGAQAAQLAEFGDWKAYATQGRPKICYALSQPTSRQPASLKDTAGFLFVSFRPADKVANEVALVMGFPTKDGGAAEAVIGTAKYDLITKGPNAWVKNPAEESQIIATMSKGRDLTVKATSGRGSATTDRYSLKGFGQALERARSECK